MSLLMVIRESLSKRDVARIDTHYSWACWIAFQRASWRAAGGHSAPPPLTARWGDVLLVVRLAAVLGKAPPEPRLVTIRS